MNTTDLKNSHSIFPLGNPGPAEWFSGTVYIQPLVAPDAMEGLYTVGQVTFAPSARTHWHSHPMGQVLLVTEGQGWYQERDKSAQILTTGVSITIPKNVEHWHGAATDTGMVHIAISNISNGSSVSWMSPVTESEYTAVNQ